MTADKIPFHVTARGKKEEEYVTTALRSGNLSSDGSFSKKCEKWLEEKTGCLKAFLTPSASSALEMAALITDIGPGDEVILPSYTFPSTANAFLLRGAIPVFIDIREDTLCMDENLLKEMITDKTRAVVPVHYGGGAAEMEKICTIAEGHGLTVIEDAAQSLLSYKGGKHIGTLGALSCISFHDTKNVGCGEGGALLVNDASLIEKTEVIRNFGTNRAAFMRGEENGYHWMCTGSSSMMSELAAACLLARLEEAEEITQRRVNAWDYYYERLRKEESSGHFRLIHLPADIQHNGHIFPLVLNRDGERDKLIHFLAARGIEAKSHYVPLHETPFGLKSARNGSSLEMTGSLGEKLIRLPLWDGIEKWQQDRVMQSTLDFFHHA